MTHKTITHKKVDNSPWFIYVESSLYSPHLTQEKAGTTRLKFGKCVKCVSQKKIHDAPIYFRNHVSVLFSAQTYPNKLPELLIKSELSRSPSNGRHAFFCVQFTPAQSQ